VSVYEAEVIAEGKQEGQVIRVIAQTDPRIAAGDTVRPVSSWWRSFVSTAGAPAPRANALQRLEPVRPDNDDRQTVRGYAVEGSEKLSRSERKRLRREFSVAHGHIADLKRVRDIDGLIAELQSTVASGSLTVRASAAHALGKLRAQESVPELTRLLDDQAEAPGVRIAAADALGKIGGPDAINALRPHLRDPDPVLKKLAMWWLAHLGQEEARPVAIAHLSDKSLFMRWASAGALGNIGHPEDLDLVRAAKRRERWFLRGLHRKAIRKLKRRARQNGGAR
jgi:HEAT repeat protein